MNKVSYIGVRENGIAHVFRRSEEEEPQQMVPLDPRLDLRGHSPTGFEWGYGGSGPAQLSLAILADYLKDEEEALAYYQDFKFSVIGGLPSNEGWFLTEPEIELALAVIRARRTKLMASAD